MRRITLLLLSFLCSTIVSAQTGMDSAMLVQHKIKSIDVRYVRTAGADTTSEYSTYDTIGRMLTFRNGTGKNVQSYRFHYRPDGQQDSSWTIIRSDRNGRPDSEKIEQFNYYDTEGHCIRAEVWQRVNGWHGCTYSRYDAKGRKVCDSVTSSSPGNPGITFYFYDKDDRLIKSIYNRTTKTYYKYDKAGRKILEQTYKDSLLDHETHTIYADKNVDTSAYSPISYPAATAFSKTKVPLTYSLYYMVYAADGRQLLLTKSYNVHIPGGAKTLTATSSYNAESGNDGLWKTSTETKTDRQGKTTITIYEYRYTFF